MAGPGAQMRVSRAGSPDLGRARLSPPPARRPSGPGSPAGAAPPARGTRPPSRAASRPSPAARPPAQRSPASPAAAPAGWPPSPKGPGQPSGKSVSFVRGGSSAPSASAPSRVGKRRTAGLRGSFSADPPPERNIEIYWGVCLVLFCCFSGWRGGIKSISNKGWETERTPSHAGFSAFPVTGNFLFLKL